MVNMSNSKATSAKPPKATNPPGVEKILEVELKESILGPGGQPMTIFQGDRCRLTPWGVCITWPDGHFMTHVPFANVKAVFSYMEPGNGE